MSNEELNTNPPESAGADEALRQERDELYDRLLRTSAEFDNYRKRTERERREWAESASADLIRDLLPVIDDFERALAVPTDDVTGPAGLSRYRGGVELIHRQLIDLLRKRGVEPLDVIGKDFDPLWHESVGHDSAEGRRDGEITTEVRRGYRIGQRLLRPAMVKVAQA